MTTLLRWIFDIAPNTPICVLAALARHRGVVHADGSEWTEQEMLELPFQTLYYSLTSVKEVQWCKEELVNLRMIARFVNPRVKWRKTPLLQAYHSILNEQKQLPTVTSFGPRTPEDPMSTDEVSLYNHCRRMGFAFHQNTPFHEMMRTFIIASVPQCVYKALSITNDPNAIFCALRGQIQENWRTEYISRDFIPREARNSNEAFFVGLDRGIDYSYADCPYGKYIGLPDYTHDKVQKINKLRIQVGVYFNPMIPPEYYTHEHMLLMADEEGIDTKESFDTMYYSMLQRSLESNFYHLLQPEVKNTHTYILHEEFKDIDPYSIVCYGKMAYNREDLQIAIMEAYSFYELTHMFKTVGDFIDPKMNTPFLNMDKLYRIATATAACETVRNDTRNDATELLTTIHFVKAKKGALGQKLTEWLSHDNLSLYVPALQALLRASMFMRGWKGPPEPYPIQKAPLLHIEELNVAVGEALHEYIRLSEGLIPPINDLPLFRHDGKTFRMSNCDFEGITIGDRIQKVLLGENISQMSSCIRLSSNWFVSSSYYYLQLIGCRPTFSIEELVDIA